MNLEDILKEFTIESGLAREALGSILDTAPKQMAQRFDALAEDMCVSEKGTLYVISLIMFLFRNNHLTEGEYRMLMQIVIEGQVAAKDKMKPPPF